MALIIERGLKPGNRLPSEEELSQRFGISRPTTREALKQLEHERVIRCVHGRGHFVEGDPRVYFDSIIHFRNVTEVAAHFGFHLSTQVHRVQKRPPTRQEIKDLQLMKDDLVIELERTCNAGSDPLVYVIDIFPERSVIGVPDEDAWRGSIVNLMEESWGITIVHSQTTIHAVRLASSIARRIGGPSTHPWIMLEETCFDTRHRPVLYSRTYHRGDKFSFCLLRKRSSIREGAQGQSYSEPKPQQEPSPRVPSQRSD
jgi:GntR family transcriptional regulator